VVALAPDGGYPDYDDTRGYPARPDTGGRTSRVRPYTLTRGRTRYGHVLLVETLVTTLDCPQEDAGDMPEVGAIVRLCRGVRSVAEVAAILHMPLGVVRVLISDLASQGRISVYQAEHEAGRPDRALLERVLGGLRKI
jgi:uncharacterized protein DUF742